MKIKFLIVLFLSITISQGQVKKKVISKAATVKGITTSVMPTKVGVAVAPKVNLNEGIFAEIETSKGKILVNLEYKKAPVTVANFVSLAEGTNTAVAEKFKGKRFYDGLKFHRVIKDFMIQGGDPDGNGSGGPGFAFKDEFDPTLVHDRGGILSMANSGPKTNGSQFFITHKETPWLNNKHSIFGSVVSGMDVVNKIAQDDVILKVTISKKGAEAKKFDATKVFSDYYANKAGDDAKQALIDAEAKKKQAEIEALKNAEYNKTYGAVKAAKVTSLTALKATSTTTPSGLQYSITQKGTGVKPVDGSNVNISYAGFLEDGTLFDSNIEGVNKQFGKFDENRAKANGYAPFPFPIGKKDGLIPGFLEGINAMSLGDKATIFIPAKLGYGERGAGNVIPPNSNIIFEIEMTQSATPAPTPTPAVDK